MFFIVKRNIIKKSFQNDLIIQNKMFKKGPNKIKTEFSGPFMTTVRQGFHSP